MLTTNKLLPSTSSNYGFKRNDPVQNINVLKDYYQLPVKRMIFGDHNFPVSNGVIYIKENNVCLGFILKPMNDIQQSINIELNFHKFMYLSPESNNGATAIAFKIDEKDAKRMNDAIFAITGVKSTERPLYIFFDLLLNLNNPINKAIWDEILQHISNQYNAQIQKKLQSEKRILTEKYYSELEKDLCVPIIELIEKDTMSRLLKLSGTQMQVIQDMNGLDYIVFVQQKNQLYSNLINECPLPSLDKYDIIQQESASGRIQFNCNDLALLKPNAWLNDKIVNWYCYYLLKQLPEEKRQRIYLCETFFYTSITKGIEKETNPLRLKKGIYENYNPKKFKQQNFFDSDFIVIPIHRSHHWFLVIIINPKGAICNIDPALSPSTKINHCYFIIFDSYKKLAINEHDATFDHLTHFLARHYDDFRSKSAASEMFNRGLVKKVFPKNMPQQSNDDDCGVYGLTFLKYFFEHLPDGYSLPDFSEWWKTFTIYGMRERIYSEIITTALNYEDIKRRHDLMKESFDRNQNQLQIQSQAYCISAPSTIIQPKKPIQNVVDKRFPKVRKPAKKISASRKAAFALIKAAFFKKPKKSFKNSQRRWKYGSKRGVSRKANEIEKANVNLASALMQFKQTTITPSVVCSTGRTYSSSINHLSTNERKDECKETDAKTEYKVERSPTKSTREQKDESQQQPYQKHHQQEQYPISISDVNSTIDDHDGEDEIEWVETAAEDGKNYYFNIYTGDTRWDAPVNFYTMEEYQQYYAQIVASTSLEGTEYDAYIDPSMSAPEASQSIPNQTIEESVSLTTTMVPSSTSPVPFALKSIENVSKDACVDVSMSNESIIILDKYPEEANTKVKEVQPTFDDENIYDDFINF